MDVPVTHQLCCTTAQSRPKKDKKQGTRKDEASEERTEKERKYIKTNCVERDLLITDYFAVRLQGCDLLAR